MQLPPLAKACSGLIKPVARVTPKVIAKLMPSVTSFGCEDIEFMILALNDILNQIYSRVYITIAIVPKCSLGFEPTIAIEYPSNIKVHQCLYEQPLKT